MSHAYYNRWWIATKKQLEDLQIRDKILQETTKPTKDRIFANYLAGGLYARYCLVVQELANCLDQTCLIQKRFAMKKLVDAATIRLDELKELLVSINFSEYHYVDGNLIEFKVMPYEIEIVDPVLVFDREVAIEDMWTQLKKGETIYTPPPPPEPEGVSVETQTSEMGIQSKEALAPPPPPPEEEPKPVPRFGQKALTEEEIKAMQHKEQVTNATLLIQSHERARQNRLYYGDLLARAMLRKRMTKRAKLPPETPREVKEAAATTISRMWRGYADRHFLKMREKERRLLIGMTEPSWRSTVEVDTFKKALDDRRALRDKHLHEYVEANLKEKERVLRVVAPGLMEDIGDEIREWFHEWYDQIRNFDKYPSPEEGGSILIVRGETWTPKQYLDEVERLRREKELGIDSKAEEKKKKAEEAKKKKEAEKKRKAAEAAAKKNAAKAGFRFKFPESTAEPILKEAFKEYHEIWDSRPFEENLLQKPYEDMISVEKCYEMQLEVRPLVDELMRLELDILNEALENDRWKAKGKKGKPPPKKPKPERKGKKGKGKKDPTGHRSTEDLFQELFDNGIIHSYPEVHLKDYIGDVSYANWEKRNQEFDPPPALGDVRQRVMLNCILPLGVETMARSKAVLLIGPRQSGKHFLANAIFYETRCVLFDCSAPVLLGKYRGKKGLKMLTHLLQKMSRILQPSIIFIDGGVKPFYSKVPAEEKDLDPKKLGKVLLKQIIKPIKPEERILVLGISSQPYAAKPAQVFKAYSKIILVPPTDYGTLFAYWKQLIMKYHGVDRNFSISELAKVSLTYSLPAVKAAAEKVLVPSRIVQFKYKPLNAHEFYDALLDGDPPLDEKEWAKITGFYAKTPNAKKRAELMAIAQEKREQLAAAEAKAKAKGK